MKNKWQKYNYKTFPVFYHNINTRTYITKSETSFPPSGCYEQVIKSFIDSHTYVQNIIVKKIKQDVFKTSNLYITFFFHIIE